VSEWATDLTHPSLGCHDEVCSIASRGLEPAKRETDGNGVRKITYRDPDGNEISFGGAPR
jgi:hypothetical protein